MVKLVNSKTHFCREWTENEFCFENSNTKTKSISCCRQRTNKAKSDFLQNVFKLNIVSCAYLLAQTYTAYVVWCGIGHGEYKFFDKVCKTAIISLDPINFSQKSQDVQLKLLHHQIKFHPIQLKSMQEIEANKFCFLLILWPQAKIKVSESVVKW